MIHTSTRPQAGDGTRLDAAPMIDAWWLEDDTDEGSPLPFGEQVYQHRARRTFEDVRSAWRQFDELCLNPTVTSEPDREACATARRTLHRSLEQLRLASSPQ